MIWGSENNKPNLPQYESSKENLVYQIISELGGNPSHFAFTNFAADNPTQLPTYLNNFNALLYEWLSIVKNQCFTGGGSAA